MLLETPTPINPTLCGFVHSDAKEVPQNVRKALCPASDGEAPRLQEFLGNATAARSYLLREFFREGWRRLANEGRFETVWDREYVFDRAQVAEARFVESWPAVGKEQRQEWVAQIHRRRDIHARPSWHFGQRRQGRHPRYTQRRVVDAEPTTMF